MPNPQNLIFDLGAVLIRLNFPHWYKVMNKWAPALKEADFQKFLTTTIDESCRGLLSDEQIMARYRAFLGSKDLSRDEIWGIHMALFVDGYTCAVDLLPELAKKYNLYILSNTDHWHIQYLSGIIPGFKELFQYQLFSYDSGFLKPEKEIYDFFLKNSGITFEHAIYFDDNPDNVAMGTSLGLKSFLVSEEKEFCAYLRKLM